MLPHMLRRVATAAAPAALTVAYYQYHQLALAEAPAAGLNPKAWVPLKLVETTPLTDNTALPCAALCCAPLVLVWAA